MSGRPARESGMALSPLVVATVLRPQGDTGVHTHFRQLLKYLADNPGAATTLSTPFDWRWPLYLPVYALRRAFGPVNGSADVLWYRHWHEVFLRGALRRQLASVGDCVIYAQDPPAARAALAARRDRRQQVVLAVHFRTSQADEWADKGRIPRDGHAFRSIRRLERAVIPRVDRLVYVSRWARDALTGWLPEAADVPSEVIGNFVAPWHGTPGGARHGDLVTIGGLEPVKNHRFLLRVLAAAKQAGHPLTLDIFGDGPLRRELQQLADGLGLTEEVRFRGFRRDVRDFLPGYRAYVHASYSESSSLAIMEAMERRPAHCRRGHRPDSRAVRRWRRGPFLATRRPRTGSRCPPRTTRRRAGPAQGCPCGAGQVQARLRRGNCRPTSCVFPVSGEVMATLLKIGKIFTKY